jgi:hypothetical protein
MLIVYIHNDGTGNSIIGNYDYTVMVNNLLIGKGRVENFQRDKGWESLVRKIVEDDNV